VACGSILLKIAVSDLIIIKMIHKFVEDSQIASSIQSLMEENGTEYATPGDCTQPTPFPMSHVALKTRNWFAFLNLSERDKEVSTCFS